MYWIKFCSEVESVELSKNVNYSQVKNTRIFENRTIIKIGTYSVNYPHNSIQVFAFNIPVDDNTSKSV